MARYILNIYIFCMAVLLVAMPAHAREGTKVYRLSMVEARDGEMPSHITRICQDKRGFLWFSSWNGLYRYDGYDFVSFKMKPGNGINIQSDRVRKLVPASEVRGAGDNILFCLIDDTYFRFDLDGYTFDNVTERERKILQERDRRPHRSIVEYAVSSNGMVVPDVTFEYRDRQGITWLNSGHGLYKLVANDNVCEPLDGVSGAVRAMYRMPGGSIIIASKDDSSVAFFSSTKCQGYLGRDGHIRQTKVPFAPVYSVLCDSRGSLWLGSKPDGLFRLRQTDGTAYSVEHVTDALRLGCKDIYDIKEDRQGRLWLATLGGGIVCITNPQARASEMKVVEMGRVVRGVCNESSRVRRLLIMPDGMLIATTTAGIVVFDNIYQPFDRVKVYRHVREGNRATSLTNSATMDMVDCGDGRIAFSTESGGVNIARIGDLCSQGCEFQHVTTSSGLSSDIVKSMTKYDDGHILLQQNDMLSVLDVRTNRVTSFRSSFFGSRLMFSEAEPLVVRNIGVTFIFLALEDGVAVTTSHDLHRKAEAPPILLTQMVVNNKGPYYSINASDTIHLDSDERSLVLRYAAMDLRDSEGICYMTRIDEGEWTHASRIHEIVLHDLDAGKHTLHIRSTNAMGLLADNERVITIIVEPTFFEAWYGRLVLLLLLCAVIGGAAYTYFYIKTIDTHRKETLEAYLALLAEHEHTATVTIETTRTVNDARAEDGAVGVKGVITPRLSNDDNVFMQRLMSFVEERMSDSNIGVQDMADATAMSRSSLNRRMHQLLGVTPADFLREARMKRACELLRTTERGMSEIAFACGFSDPKYFGKQFKATMGVSAREYRSRQSRQGREVSHAGA